MARRKPVSSRRMKNNFSRGKPYKSQRYRILIVCEDSVTAPMYFKELCVDKGLSNTDVEVCGEECGSDPGSVYRFTKEKIESEIKNKGEDDGYDCAYCVIDKDGHRNFESTLRDIKKYKNPKTKIISAESIPCFEIWVLLHFEGKTRPFKNCDAIEEILKTHIPKYKKRKMRNLYPYLKDKTDAAIKNAKKILKELENTEADNPSTKIHLLIEDLITESKK